MAKIEWKIKEEPVETPKTPLELLTEKVASLELRIVELENKTP